MPQEVSRIVGGHRVTDGDYAKGAPVRVDLPEELDQEIAGIKLETMGLSIDSLSDEQIAYATDYSAGT